MAGCLNIGGFNLDVAQQINPNLKIQILTFMLKNLQKSQKTKNIGVINENIFSWDYWGGQRKMKL